MILKGSQRANGADLAIHLMNGFDNESVQIAEVYGTVAGDLAGALAEFEAVAQGTKAEQYLYSLSINPSASLSREQYYDCIATIEDRLGLGDQPRAIVFHIKDGREHCHVVWSRIDVEAMKAIPMSHDRRKLMDLACDLAHKYNLELPPGLKAWEAKQKFGKPEIEPTLAEKAQQDEHGITPEQRREEITACYEQADGAEAFVNALEQKGYVLAAGDRRGFVVVDRFANVHSLTRYVKDHKAAAIRKRLAPLTPDNLPTVDQAKEIVRQRKQARDEGEGERREQIERQYQEVRRSLATKQAARHAKLLQKEQKLLTRQQDETLQLHGAQASESQGITFAVRTTIADLMRRTPGLRSVFRPIQKFTHLDPKERQEQERAALERRHVRERRDTEREKRTLSRVEVREKQGLDRKLKRLVQEARSIDNRAKQEFYEAARDRGARGQTDMGEGALAKNFNDAAEFTEGPPDSDGDHDDDGLNWKQRTEEGVRGRRPRRGKGYRFGRNDD